MKNHLKRIATPKTWILNRLKNKYVVRPNPGSHSFDRGMALGMILRDQIHLAKTMSEVKKILHSKEILVDGKRRKDHRLIVGLFDVISVPSIKMYYRVMLDQKGRLIMKDISSQSSQNKICKVVRKTMLSKGRLQIGLHDGRSLIHKDKISVGDSVVIDFSSNKITELLPLEPECAIFLTSGKHAGDVGTLKELKGKEAMYESDKKEIETARNYVLVIGHPKSKKVSTPKNAMSFLLGEKESEQ